MQKHSSPTVKLPEVIEEGSSLSLLHKLLQEAISIGRTYWDSYYDGIDPETHVTFRMSEVIKSDEYYKFAKHLDELHEE